MIGCVVEQEGFRLTKPYYEKREITDFKDLINQSVSIYGNKNAFSVKGIIKSIIAVNSTPKNNN